MKAAPKPPAHEPARPGEIAIGLPDDFDAGVYFIGTIRTPWKTRAEYPKNPRESKGAVCTIVLDDRYRAGVAGLEAFTHVVVVYFMDRSQRDLIVQVPRHLGLPRGTFALRSPARPNPIALSVAKLIGIDGNRLTVAGLDCLDGTPLLDLKPYLPAVDATGWEAATPAAKKSARSSEK